ncbi:ribonucleoside diphosphate reductase large subunit [Indivirus ILV1]|uniref:Ribonucleoside-diphosphate reductase n=1 Tax=Indivirus ILV1 TaxID=1977633 RepID=A0A1V0SDH6_9VIRU|nr:ribonucleoside diphosphate reductase large subunit [Indivirus ILV1]
MESLDSNVNINSKIIDMSVIKRDGRTEPISFDKILRRIQILCAKLNLNRIDTLEITKDTIKGLSNGITTEEIDHFAAVKCAERIKDDPQYDDLAAALCISRLHKMTSGDFMEVTDRLCDNTDKDGNFNPLVTLEYVDFVKRNIASIQKVLDENYNLDYNFDYFGFKTLERAYLHRIKESNNYEQKSKNATVEKETKLKNIYGKIIERPQHLFMRVAIALNLDNIDRTIELYKCMANGKLIFGSPTLYNAGSSWQQMSSCFLLKMGDSLESILGTMTDTGLISKRAGGIGISISDVRASGSYIRGTNGTSSGIIPMIQVFNWLGRYINQGGRRNGAIACFTKDTEVFTTNNGIRKIQDVKIGDLVVTHKNRIRPVTQVHKNPLGDRKIYKLVVERNKDIYVTGNHKFWSLYTKKYKHNQLSLGWNSIEELKNLMDNKETTRQACYISIPSGTNITDSKNYKIDVMDYKDIIESTDSKLNLLDSNKIMLITTTFDETGKKNVSNSHPINRVWNITEDLANLFGIWLGDGHIKTKETGTPPIGIGIVCDKNNKKEIEFIKKVCKETFDCNISEYTSAICKRNVTEITINSNIVGLIFNKLFGSYFDGKKLPSMIFNWPKTLVDSLIAGLLSTNGNITKNKCNAVIGLSNENLINQLYHLSRANGIAVSFVKGKIGKGMTCNPYTISVPLSENILKQIHRYYTDDRIERCLKKLENGDNIDKNFLKILEITETDRKDEYVYTLGIEEDHSYTVEGLLAENCYIEPWHADIFHFCELRSNKGKEEERARDIFLALWICDLFMKRVQNNEIWSLMCPDECPGLTTSFGEEFEKLYLKYEKEGKYKKQVRASDLWFHILTSQIETGMPYMLYKDNVNRQTNQSNLGVIQSSNLCVSGDTYILTDNGQIPIKDIVNQKVNVWNGIEFSNVIIKQTGIDQKLIKIKFSNGVEIKCTPEHKFYIIDDAKYQKQIMVQADQLKLNDKLIKYELPTEIKLSDSNDMKYPYTHGFYSGNEYTSLKYPKAYLYGEKKLLLKYLKYESYSVNELTDRYDLVLPKDMREKFFVPLNQSLETTLRWFEGYCDANGTIIKNGTNESLQITSIDKDFLLKIKLMLQVIGIDSKVTKNKNARKGLLTDNKEGINEYECKVIYKLLINSNGLYNLSKLGFSPKQLIFSEINQQQDTTRFIKVVGIEKIDEKENTYCFTEPKRHMGMFNGVLTGQCAEIVEYTSADEIAVCNLSSICLPRFVKRDSENNLYYDFKELEYIAGVVTYNLNNVIDINYYPVEKARKSNMRHRPIGIGVQGLADVYCTLGLAYDSDEARILNKKIFETIYYGSLKMSNQLAKEKGPYETFWYNGGSPFSKGKLQYHLWGLKTEDLLMGFDWDGLIEDIIKYGTRNSLLTTVMPTASTSQIMGNSEYTEPITSNVYIRTTLAGEFVVVNRQLVETLLKLGLWTEQIRYEIIYDNGSIQNIDEIPDEIKKIYKTAVELKNKPIVQQSIERGPFIDQSQSLNLFCKIPDFNSLASSHFYAWKNKAKTGMYYLKTQPAVDAIKFGLDPQVIEIIENKRKNKGKPIMSKKETNDDPRRLNEIEISHGPRTSKFNCDSCSG